MIFEPLSWNDSLNTFTSSVEFSDLLSMNQTQMYELTFYYMINYDACQRTDVKLSVSLVDDELYLETLFESNEQSVDASMRLWNKVVKCFKVSSGDYKLTLMVENNCENDRVFLALDEFSLRVLKNSNECSSSNLSTLPSSPKTSTVKSTSNTSVSGRISSISTSKLSPHKTVSIQTQKPTRAHTISMVIVENCTTTTKFNTFISLKPVELSLTSACSVIILLLIIILAFLFITHCCNKDKTKAIHPI